MIEKHFTIDRTMGGSGHSFSVDASLLKDMVKNIRLTEESLGKEDIRVIDAEQKTRQSARMSIVAYGNIRKNEIITEEMLTFKRPGTGILPKFIDGIIGKKAARDISADEQISWSDIG